MNSPGWGDRTASATGSRHNVAKSGLSTTRLRTRYGTGAMGGGVEPELITPSVIASRPGHFVHLFSDVDTSGTPCDASPAPDAARHAELVVPGAQLVGQPMPVTRGARL